MRKWVYILLFTIGTDVFSAYIKNLVHLDGDRDNQLVGYGLVVGLDGKGDTAKTASTAYQSMQNMMLNFGIKDAHNLDNINPKNIAAVMVTADVKSFAKNGSRMDVLVSSIGDAKSLQGGILLQTPLKGADGNVYAVAQGSVVVGGFMVSSGASESDNSKVSGSTSVQKNHTTVGRVIDGAIIEKEIPVNLLKNDSIDLNLVNPNFVTAVRIADCINKKFPGSSQALSPANVNVIVPEAYRGQLTNFVAQIGTYDVIPDTKAKIIVNERTGTIVATEQVRISTVAVSHGSLTITVAEEASASQPEAFAEKGDTKVVKNTTVQVKDTSKSFMMLNEFPTVQELTSALNQIGASTRDMITILQSIKAAGALQAELITL